MYPKDMDGSEALTESTADSSLEGDLWNMSLSDFMDISASEYVSPRRSPSALSTPSAPRVSSSKPGMPTLQDDSSEEEEDEDESFLFGPVRATPATAKSSLSPIRRPDSTLRHSAPARLAPRRCSSLKKPSPTGPGATPKRSVSFDKVKIREFERVLGDHPAQEGPSIALGWNYNEAKEVSIDKYENKNNSCNTLKKKWTSARNLISKNGNKKKEDFLLSAEKRVKIAKQLGYTTEEIQQNIKDVEKLRKQREQQNLLTMAMQGGGLRYNYWKIYNSKNETV